MTADRLSITQKIFSVVAVFAAVVMLIGATTWIAASRLTGEIVAVDADGKAVVLAARMNTNVQAMNALQMRVLSDPSPATREAVGKALAQERALFDSRAVKLTEGLAGTDAAALAATVQTHFTGYLATLDALLAAVDAQDPAAVALSSATASRESAVIREDVRALFRGVETVAADKLSKSMDFAHAAQVFVLVSAAIGLALGSALAWMVTHYGVTRPLEASVAGLEKLAAGDLDMEVHGIGRGDEIGKVARAMQVFKDRLVNERELARQTEARRQAEMARAETLARLTSNFEEQVRGVLTTVGGEVHQLEDTSTAMSAAAHNASERAQAAAAAALQAAGNVETVASAAEQLSGSIGEIGRQVSHANTVSRQATEEADHTDELVRSLSDTATRIGDVVATINAIAHQTNMLALNATIEAARAGDAGKGFGIVADEVKHLAAQTAKATHEVAAQVQAVREGVGQAVSAIHHITSIIGEVGEASAGIASAVEQQAAATAEIARNVEQAAQGTNDVSGNMDGVQAAAGTTGDAAQAVLEIAHGVAGDAGKLRGMVEDFLTAVRAA